MQGHALSATFFYASASRMQSERVKLCSILSGERNSYRREKQMTATQTQKFNPELYAPIKSNHLVVYAIYDLQKRVDTISSEDVVSACFTLFPKRFSLQKYPQWPDSAMIARRLHDCRIKRWIAAKTDHEVRLTFKGMRLAERTARALGLKVPVWKPKTVVKLQVTEVVKPAPVAKPKIKPRKRVDGAKVVGKSQVDKLQVTKAVKPAPAAKPAPAKLKDEKVKEKRVDKLQVTEAVKPVTVAKPVTIKPKVVKAREKRVAEVKVAEAVKPAPATRPGPTAKPKAKVVPPSTAPRQLSLLPTVSAEEKARAGKFVKMMEASDAYRLYKKNGANANIGEFDFRSLLLCTMESSHETLARNVELFKGYAGIHNRQDLTAFLGFCTDKFAHLLLPEKKVVRKLK